MNTKYLLLIVLLIAPSAAFPQSSIEQIEAEIEQKKAENAAAEAVNPTMKLELERKPTQTDLAISELAVMRKLLNQMKLVNREVEELSDNHIINQILLDPNLSIDQRLEKAMKHANLKREKELKEQQEKQERLEAKERQAKLALSGAKSPVVKTPKTSSKAKNIVRPKPISKPVTKVEPITVSFIHEYKDGSPTKVGLKAGLKLGFTGIVGGYVSNKINNVQYKIASVSKVGESERYKGRPLYRVVIKDEKGRPTSLNFE